MSCRVGDSDSMVHIDYGKKTADLLRNYGCTVRFSEYPGLDHAASQQVSHDIAVQQLC